MEKYQRPIPVERAGHLDSRLRKLMLNPKKILDGCIKEGMVVLEVGCGPGFYTPEIARMVGSSGKVIAADLQDGMLQKMGDKIKGTGLEGRVMLHKCESDRIGVTEKVDIVLAFSMVHEVADKRRFLGEIRTILKPGGRLYVIENLLHPPKRDFEDTMSKAKEAGFEVVERPAFFWSRAAILRPGDHK